MTNKDYKIVRERGRVELEIPHEEIIITFVSPAKGPNSYAKVQEEITQDGLVAPTMAQIASLVYTANRNRKEPEFAEILDILDNNLLWGFNGILYVPDEGVYIQDNPKIRRGRVVLDKSELEKKVQAGDKSVRFVPFGFKRAWQSAPEFAENPFIIALAGAEGAEKLAEVSGKYRNEPFVHSYENVNEEVARVSGLHGGYRRNKLCVDGDCVDYFVGYALGVRKTGAESAKSAKK